MDPSVDRHIAFLDPIRGIAILLVFVFHSLGSAFGLFELPWGPWIRDFHVTRSFLALLPLALGWSGVAVFFVVSGFCIHLSFLRTPKWPVFFWRRFFRIYPPYVIAVLFFAVVFPILRHRFELWDFVLQLVTHLGLVHNFHGSTLYGVNGSFWSIAVEVQLYALYPVLLWLTRRLGWPRAIQLLAIVEIGLRVGDGLLFTSNGVGLPVWLESSPLFFWFSWSVGALLAERYLEGRLVPPARWLSPALLVAAFVSDFIKPLSSLPFPLFALFTATVIARALTNRNPEPAAAGFASRHLRQAGVWSYSLYLWHQPLLRLVPFVAAKLVPGTLLHPLVLFGVCLSTWFAMMPISRLLYQWVELPSIAAGKRFCRHLRRPVDVAPAAVVNP